MTIDWIVSVALARASEFGSTNGTGSNCVPLRIATPGAVEYPDPGSSTTTPVMVTASPSAAGAQFASTHVT